MSYDPTQQVPPPQGYPQQPGYPQQNYPQQQGYPQQSYPEPQPPTYPQYSGQPPAPAGAGFDFNAFWKKLGLTGQVCAIGGLVLFIALLLPWFSFGISCSGLDCGAVNASLSGESTSYSAWYIATHSDLSAGTSASSFIFILLWLVIIASVALVAIPIITALGKFNAKQGQMFILIAAGVALLIEIIYMIRAFTILSGVTTSESFGGTTVSVSAGPGFGFWLGLLATLAAGGVYVYFNYMKKPAMGGMPMGGYSQPYQQPGQYPPSQPYQQPGQYPPSQPYQQPGQYPPSQPPQYPGQ